MECDGNVPTINQNYASKEEKYTSLLLFNIKVCPVRHSSLKTIHEGV